MVEMGIGIYPYTGREAFISKFELYSLNLHQCSYVYIPAAVEGKLFTTFQQYSGQSAEKKS